MTVKYKVSDFAKDLNISAKKVLDELAAMGSTGKKNSSTLEENELNYLLEKFSKDNSVASLDEYLNSAKQPAQPEKKAEKKAEKPAEKKAPAAPTDGVAPEAKAEEFLRNVTKLMGVDVTIDSKRDDEGNVRVDMHGDTLGILIGRRGETLDALQYLTSLYVNRGQEGYTRVTLDTENYRAKREEALTRLANRMANRAVKTGRKVVLEPMNPYERRILHSALQKNENVSTHSEGEEPNRHVVITLNSKG